MTPTFPVEPIGIQRKLDELRIELQRRRDTFPALVAEGKMTLMEQDRQIMMIEAIISDYVNSAKEPEDSPEMAVVRELAALSESLPPPPEQAERVSAIISLAKEVIRPTQEAT